MEMLCMIDQKFSCKKLVTSLSASPDWALYGPSSLTMPQPQTKPSKYAMQSWSHVVPHDVPLSCHVTWMVHFALQSSTGLIEATGYRTDLMHGGAHVLKGFTRRLLDLQRAGAEQAVY